MSSINYATTQVFVSIPLEQYEKHLSLLERLEKRLDYYETKEVAPTQSNDDEFVTRLQAATLLNVKSLVTIDHYAKKGLLKKHRLGAMVRFKKSEVLAFKAKI